METIRALILRLQQQSDQHASAADLLATVHVLQSALQESMEEPVRKVKSGNISVVFPSGNRLVPPKQAEEKFSPVQEKQTEPPAPKKEILHLEEKLVVAAATPTPEPDFNPIEVPTLSHQKKFREMNDIFGQESSLNDHLKAERQEIASILNEEPVKDLRKAIGINDRFVYLSELFRGDEVMYERSLKTINNFRIYPEAEYWIERELKVKMGWDETKDAVKQFRQLVRRRFLG